MYICNVQLFCMNVVNATTLRDNLKDTLDEVKKKDYLLVAKRGEIISAIVDIDYFEDLLAATSPKYIESIKRAREDIKKGRVYTLEEVFGEI